MTKKIVCLCLSLVFSVFVRGAEESPTEESCLRLEEYSERLESLADAISVAEKDLNERISELGLSARIVDQADSGAILLERELSLSRREEVVERFYREGLLFGSAALGTGGMYVLWRLLRNRIHSGQVLNTVTSGQVLNTVTKLLGGGVALDRIMTGALLVTMGGQGVYFAIRFKNLRSELVDVNKVIVALEETAEVAEAVSEAIRESEDLVIRRRLLERELWKKSVLVEREGEFYCQDIRMQIFSLF